MAIESRVIRHFFMMNYNDWDISDLLNQDIIDESKFVQQLFRNDVKKINGRLVTYPEKYTLMDDIKKQQLFNHEIISSKSSEIINYDSELEDDDSTGSDAETDEDDDIIAPSTPMSPAAAHSNANSIPFTFIRSASSLKHPIYFVLNLKPQETNLAHYPQGTLQRCVKHNRFDISKFEFRFEAKNEPKLLLKQKNFSTAATTVTGCIAAPLLRIFPYLVPFDIVVQVSTKFVLQYPEWSIKFEEFLKNNQNKTDLDLINWLAVKIKSRFTTRAKDILIPLGLYRDKIECSEETSLDDIHQEKLDVLVDKKNQETLLPTTTILKASKPKKTPICPQYFDYKATILCLHQQHKEFLANKSASNNFKSKKNNLKDSAQDEIERIGSLLQPIQVAKQCTSSSLNNFHVDKTNLTSNNDTESISGTSSVSSNVTTKSGRRQVKQKKSSYSEQLAVCEGTKSIITSEVSKQVSSTFSDKTNSINPTLTFTEDQTNLAFQLNQVAKQCTSSSNNFHTDKTILTSNNDTESIAGTSSVSSDVTTKSGRRQVKQKKSAYSEQLAVCKGTKSIITSEVSCLPVDFSKQVFSTSSDKTNSINPTLTFTKDQTNLAFANATESSAETSSVLSKSSKFEQVSQISEPNSVSSKFAIASQLQSNLAILKQLKSNYSFHEPQEVCNKTNSTAAAGSFHPLDFSIKTSSIASDKVKSSITDETNATPGINSKSLGSSNMVATLNSKAEIMNQIQPTNSQSKSKTSKRKIIEQTLNQSLIESTKFSHTIEDDNSKFKKKKTSLESTQIRTRARKK